MIPTEIFAQKITVYFNAERMGGMLILGIGISAMVLSFYLYKTESLYKGMIYPLVSVGLIQGAVGFVVAGRSENQGKVLIEQFRISDYDFKIKEGARMAKVVKSFRIIKIFEVILILCSVVISIIFIDNILFYSIAIGTIAQASTTLVFDLFAEQRAWIYLEFIRSL
jgi:hypothetical protein